MLIAKEKEKKTWKQNPKGQYLNDTNALASSWLTSTWNFQ